MTAPEFQASPTPPASTASRVLFGIAGLIALIIGAVVTLGMAILGQLAIGIVWFVQRRRKRQLTRAGAWMASVVGTIVPFALLAGAGLLIAPSPSKDLSSKEVAEARARTRDSMPEWMRSLTPAPARPNPAADSIAQKLMKNKGVMVWIGAMTAIVGSSIIGAIAGTIGWGATMLLYRAYRGEWLRTKADEPLAAPTF